MTGYASGEPVPRDKPHHYVFDIDYCPVCGSTRVHRTRVAGPKPEPTEDNPHPTHRQSGDAMGYDYCDVL